MLAVLAALGYRDVTGTSIRATGSRAHRVELVDHGARAACDEHRDGAVVLLHSWPDVTAGALPRVIDGLRERAPESALRPVGLDEVVGS